MTTIEVDQNTAQILQTLKAKAAARGVTLEELLKPLAEEDSETDQASASRNEEMLAVIRRTSERLKDLPVRGSTADTLKMIRAARGGEMWGDEPADTE